MDILECCLGCWKAKIIIASVPLPGWELFFLSSNFSVHVNHKRHNCTNESSSLGVLKSVANYYFFSSVLSFIRIGVETDSICTSISLFYRLVGYPRVQRVKKMFAHLCSWTSGKRQHVWSKDTVAMCNKKTVNQRTSDTYREDDTSTLPPTPLYDHTSFMPLPSPGDIFHAHWVSQQTDD